MASDAFKMEDGTAAGDLMIENDRLKTTLMILNQKLKLQDHSEEIEDNLTKKVQDH